MRVLGRLRLSRSTEESTSIRRQREIITAWAEANNHAVVGFAEDVDVSGSIDAFDTAEFGDWLNNRAPEFDVIACWKLDRLGRNSIQLNKLFGWCIDHGKVLVSTSEGIDLSTPVGRLIANVIAFLAEGELEQIRDRQRSSRNKLRELGRWPGGKPPYGYKAVKAPDGWTLEIDPDAHQVVQRIVNDVIDGKTLGRIARELTEEGYLSPAAYYATVKAGHPTVQIKPGLPAAPAGAYGKQQWSATPMRNMLRSKALRGFVHHKGETVRDADGMPIQVADPLVTLDEWDLLQAALDTVQAGFLSARPAESSPLAGVAVCYDHEGVPLHHSRNAVKRGDREYTYRHYRCQTRKCVAIPADDLETLAEESFLWEVGDLEVRERVWVPGDNHEAELREAVAGLDELTQAAGRARSATAKHRYQAQLDALDAKIAALELAPALEARWEYRPTGKKYREVWEASDTVARRELLIKSGIKIAASIHGVSGRRTAYNAGAFLCDIRVPSEITQTLGVGE